MQLELSSLSLSYAGAAVIRSVDLSLTTGVTAVLGINGSGKTTLMRGACGIKRPTTGSVHIDGLDPYAARERRAALSRLALIPQFLNAPRHSQVRDFLSYVCVIRGVPSPLRPARIARALATVGLGDVARSRVGTLSGGMVKRLSIAQALLGEPGVLLCDEPTAGLDADQRDRVRDLVADLGSRHTLLMTSHLIEDTRDLADRIVVLHDGRLVFDGGVRDLEALDPRAEGLGGQALERAFLHLVRRAAS